MPFMDTTPRRVTLVKTYPALPCVRPANRWLLEASSSKWQSYGGTGVSTRRFGALGTTPIGVERTFVIFAVRREFLRTGLSFIGTLRTTLMRLSPWSSSWQNACQLARFEAWFNSGWNLRDVLIFVSELVVLVCNCIASIDLYANMTPGSSMFLPLLLSHAWQWFQKFLTLHPCALSEHAYSHIFLSGICQIRPLH